jgi:hypothetical protein
VLMCLDKRTGKVLHQEETVNNAFGTYDLDARPEDRTVEVRLPTQTISMTFTDEPLPAEAPAKGDKPEQQPDDVGNEQTPDEQTPEEQRDPRREP